MKCTTSGEPPVQLLWCNFSLRRVVEVNPNMFWQLFTNLIRTQCWPIMGECRINLKCRYLFLILRPVPDTRMNGHQGMGCMAIIGNFQLSNQPGSHRQRSRSQGGVEIAQCSYFGASDWSDSNTNLLPGCYPHHSDNSLWSYCKLMDTWLKQNLDRSDESHHTPSF